jgi:tetratricopeptide (TPR) repeat protein
MVKKQWILTCCAMVTVAMLFYFGRTAAPKSNTNPQLPTGNGGFSIGQFITASKKKLSPSQAIALGRLENSVTRGNVNAELVEANTQLAYFWKDSLHAFEPYAFYLAEAAKLDKSEKKLTFAAQLILDNLRTESDLAKLKWKAEEAIGLFEKAIESDPGNDDLKVGLGSCYIFGEGRAGGPEQTMKGIQQLLQVVRKDSTNMKAQLVLGVGGYISGQYDKAIERLLKVVLAQPENLEAIAYLAQSYEGKGDGPNAIKWYQLSKRLVNDPRYSKEVDEHIRQMQ